MKNVKDLSLLVTICFTYFTYSQSINSDPIELIHSCNTIKVTVTDSYKEGIPLNFSISISKPLTKISQIKDLTELDACFHNKSSKDISNKDFKICLVSRHLIGSVINPECDNIRGGVGGICIPPLVGAGQIVSFPERLEMPNSLDDIQGVLALGEHLFNIEIYVNDNIIAASTSLNFTVSNNNSTNVEVIDDCNSKNAVNATGLVSVYPNPFTDNIVFDVSLLKLKSNIKLELYNKEGLLKDQKTFTDINLNSLNYYNNDLPSGLYFYKLIFQDKIITGSLICR